MKRLTGKHPQGGYHVLCGACPRNKKECTGLDDCVYVLTKRLAEYEESGLSPEEIKNMLSPKSVTNGAWIRRMEDEALAEKLYDLWHKKLDKGGDIARNWCDGSCTDSEACNPEKHKACIVRWLRQPAKEDA